MEIVLFGLVTFAVLFGGGMLGLVVGNAMHEKYHDNSTKAIVQTAQGWSLFLLRWSSDC